jgi:serine/threonine protein kinase
MNEARPLPPTHCGTCGELLDSNQQGSICNRCAYAAFDAAIDEDGFSIPGYETPQLISRGGMGVVYRARQLRPARDVALKVLLTHLADDAEMQARFHVEARAMAALQHPRILPIYEVGEIDGMPFFSMMLATGGTLAERLEKGPLPPRVAAALIAELCRALHYAHQQGLLHRDLKPENFLFDAEGRCYITDFGLAKLAVTAPADALTKVDAFLGTPHYMPPEVAGGSVNCAATTADIYSMGAVLYQCLSGRRPYETTENLAALLREISEGKFAPLRSHHPHLSRDLEVICAKAMESVPAARYASAADLADDLERWLEGLPINARPLNLAERTWRLAKRHPLSASLIALLMLTALMGGMMLVVNHRERGKLLAVANQRLCHSLIDQARAERLLGTPGHRHRSLGLLRQAAEILPLPEIRDEAAAVLISPDIRALDRSAAKVISSNSPTAEWPSSLNGDDPVSTRMVTSDGIWALSFHETSGRAAVWKSGNSKPIETWDPPSGRAISGGILPNGKGAIIADTASGILSLTFDPLGIKRLRASGESAITTMSISPAGELAALGMADGLTIINTEDGSLAWKVPSLPVLCTPAWSADGNLLAIANAGNRGVSLYSAHTKSKLLTIPTNGWPMRIAMHPQSHLLAIVDDANFITIAESATGRIWANFPSAAREVKFSSDGQHLIAGDDVWLLENPAALREWRSDAQTAKDEAVFGLALSPNGKHLLTTATSGVRIWSVADGKLTGFYAAENQRIDAPTAAWWLDDDKILLQVLGGLESIAIRADGVPGVVEKIARIPGSSIMNVDESGAWLVRIMDDEEKYFYEIWPKGDTRQAIPAEVPDEKVRSPNHAMIYPDGRISVTFMGVRLLLTPPPSAVPRSAILSTTGDQIFVLCHQHRVLAWDLLALTKALKAEGFGIAVRSPSRAIE